MATIFRDYVAEAQFILKSYPIKPNIIKQTQYDSKKAVWFVKTNENSYALKRYTLTKEKWSNIISAYYFLFQKGFNIAPLIVTNSFKPWIVSDNNFYILTNWVKGDLPNFENIDDILKITKSIANLHLYSKEYTPQTREYKDNNIELKRKQGLLLEYKYEAENQKNDEFSLLYLKHFEYFFESWENTSQNFNKSAYKKLIKNLDTMPCLCLNSFAPLNFSLDTSENIWILHLDKIHIDLPVLDLRQFIFKIMYTNDCWDKKVLSQIMKKYLEIYPLTEEELNLLLIDLQIPHLFFNISTRYFLFPASKTTQATLTKILHKAIKLEKEKKLVLKDFWELIKTSD
ncbi:spore coat protein, CotS family [Desulfonispora thiosulfatigenes DSM 11270]|uniref:Spore coat protein, CotS family n=1 Tax=Desulfonispora thiosulfatigenes DSM 11270 TaxID=656914 RepID=A0A1W1VH23_DESTI|nr:CotS family spore coat protein [Desulfonispora thiosulfatigenes]SMB92677.1 spore coat protein, CotS family [Desulfonispora thiosulfatigenes DSM 11270]